MIIDPSYADKVAENSENITHVFYAAVPQPADAEDVNNLSTELHEHLTIDDAPPAYDAATLNAQIHAAYAPTETEYPAEKAIPNIPSDAGDATVFTALYEPDKPPPSFSRQVPGSRDVNEPGASTSSSIRPSYKFSPLVLHSRSKKLEDGFYLVPPHTDMQPHPFSQRDVREADWIKYVCF